MEYENRDTALHILVAGRSPSWIERERWQRAMRGVRPLLPLLMVALTAIFGYDAIIMAIMSQQWEQIIASFLLVVAAGLAVVFFPISESHRTRVHMQTEWYDEQADRYRLACGCVLALYGDRIVRTDVRGAQTLYYSQVTDCVESTDGFLLSGNHCHLLIRSQDLTSYDARLIRQHLQERLPASRFRVRGAAMAGLVEPLPIPKLSNNDVVLSRATVTLRQPWLSTARRRRVNNVLRGIVLPAMVVFGVNLSNLLAFTDVYFLDLLLICGCFVAVGVLCVKLLSSFGKRKVSLSLAFTRQGLACFAAETYWFIPWERLRMTMDTKMVRLQFSDNNTLPVPLDAIDDPEALTRLLQVR